MGPIAGTDRLAQALSARDPRVVGAFPVGEMPGGRAIELSFTVLHGPSPGPTVWVIAARDGDEVHATLVAMEVQSRIRPEGLRGTVVVIPVVNVPGFEVLARAHPLAPSFLGPALDGKLFEAIVRRGGYLVDLHSAGTQADTIDWTLHLDGNDQAEGMARAFGVPLVYAHRLGGGSGPNPGLLDGALFTRATESGVPAILVESGGGLPPDPTRVTRTADGVLRVLSHLGVVDLDGSGAGAGVASWGGAPRVIHGFRILTPEHGGLMEPAVRLGEEVSEGQVLARIHDLHGVLVEEVRSTVVGVILTIGLNPAVGTGTWLMEIGW